MAQHPNEVTITNGSPGDLVKTFGKTSYKYQKEFFEKLTAEYKRQSIADKKRGNPQLSILLYLLAQTLFPVVKIFQKIWKICKPRMKN